MKHALDIGELWYCRAYSCIDTNGKAAHRYEDHFGEEGCPAIGNSANPNSSEYVGKYRK